MGALTLTNLMQGWIKLHRQLLEWEWYSDISTFRLFTHLLLMANHKDKKYRGMILKAGTVITGRELLAKQTGLTVQQVRTSIERLKSTNEITNKTSPQGTVIEIVKYINYQLITNEVTNEQPTTNQQLTTNKKVKKVKKGNNYYRAFDKLSLTDAEFTKLEKLFRKEDIDFVLDQIENYKGNSKYKSLYLTANNWLKRSYTPKQQTESIEDRIKRINLEAKR